MASAVELIWQYFWLMSVFLIILILVCCFAGCWTPFLGGMRRACGMSMNWSCAGCFSCFSCFSKTKKPKRKRTLLTKTADGGTKVVVVDLVDDDEEAAEAPSAALRKPNRGEGGISGNDCGTLFVTLLTCGYCCGLLAPDESRGPERETLITVAQPVVNDDQKPKVAVPAQRVLSTPGGKILVEQDADVAVVALPLLAM